MKKGLVVLIALCLVMAALVAVKNQSTKKKQAPVSFVQDVVEQKIVIDDLTQVMFQHNGSMILIGFWQERWIVQTLLGARAKVDLIEDLIKAVNNLEGEVRSSSEEFLADYRIQDSDAIRITFKSDETNILELLIGRVRNGAGNFVRLADSNKVYAVQNDFLEALGLKDQIDKRQLDSQPWVDNQLIEMDHEKVVEVIIDGEGIRALHVKKDDEGQWKFSNEYAFNVNQERVQQYLKMIENQQAYKVNQASDVGMDDVDWTMTMTFDDGNVIKLTRKVVDGTFYMRINDLPYVREMSVYHFDNFHKSDWDIFEKNVLGFDKDIATQLIIDGPGKMKDVVITPEDIPVDELEELKKDHDEDMLGPIATRRWRNKEGKLYWQKNMQQILSMVENQQFKFLVKLDKKPKKKHMTITFTQNDEEQQYSFYAKRKKDNCYPLVVEGNNYGYCIFDDQMARWENALIALQDNAGTPEPKEEF